MICTFKVIITGFCNLSKGLWAYYRPIILPAMTINGTKCLANKNVLQITWWFSNNIISQNQLLKNNFVAQYHNYTYWGVKSSYWTLWIAILYWSIMHQIILKDLKGLRLIITKRMAFKDFRQLHDESEMLVYWDSSQIWALLLVSYPSFTDANCYACALSGPANIAIICIIVENHKNLLLIITHSKSDQCPKLDI